MSDFIACRYPDQPEKFMDSEIELDEAINELQVIAGAPGTQLRF